MYFSTIRGNKILAKISEFTILTLGDMNRKVVFNSVKLDQYVAVFFSSCIITIHIDCYLYNISFYFILFHSTYFNIRDKK